MNTSVIIRQQPQASELARLGVLDRLALHGGLALIRWAAAPARQRRIERRSAAARYEPVATRRELVEAQHRAGTRA